MKSNYVRNEHSRDIFNLDISTDKPVYKAGEPVQINAELEYKGLYDDISLYSNGKYIKFDISDSNGFKTIGYGVLSENSVILTKTEPLKLSCKADSASEFLQLPASEYTIKASSNFSLTDELYETRFMISNEIKISVR